MALELRQQLKLTQQLIMTPQLQQAIKLLQLSRQELLETINQQLEENVALEEDTHESVEEERLSQQTEALPLESDRMQEVKVDEEKLNDNIDWSNYLDEYNAPGRIHFESEARERPEVASFTASRESLDEHLLWQLLMTSPTEEEEALGSLIAGNLSPDGFLFETTVEEIAAQNGSTPEKVEQVLTQMQTFDPVGVCARDLKECLLIQARYFNLDNTLVTEIISNHLHHITNKNYKAIARALKISIDEVTNAVDIIQGLEPKPGREFTEDEAQYIEPDIYVYKFGDDFEIWLNDDGMPRLRVSNFDRMTMAAGGKIPESARDYLQDKMRSAQWLLRSIEQRKKTIERVMESILKFQREFFEKGIEYLKPMVLKDVAQDIDKHESTISRVTTNKYAHTPQGIFELKYFFNSSISRVYGEAIASASVQQKIRQIIENEDAANPYSDIKISEMLKENNVDIARRTVAKYRELMRILPSSKRKRI